MNPLFPTFCEDGRPCPLAEIEEDSNGSDSAAMAILKEVTV
jgi:hypothetical protein